MLQQSTAEAFFLWQNCNNRSNLIQPFFPIYKNTRTKMIPINLFQRFQFFTDWVKSF